MRIFDSHAHYDDPRFEEEFEGGQSAVLAHVFSQGVERVVNIGANIPTSKASVALAQKYERIYAAVGIHPNDCGKYGTLEDELSEIKKLACCDKVVAIGEIGMDFHWDEPSADVQREWFDAQLSLAEELDLPVCIHDREAHGQCMDIVRAHPGARGVFHSFSGSSEMAHELIGRGWMISFSGVVTFKNATRLEGVVDSIPLDRMMVETDCPYLSPHPLRGSLNHSGNLVYTISRIAEIKGIPADELARITYENACGFYGIK